MLIEFRLGNFRSIAEEQVLSLVATSAEDSTERPRSVTGSNKKLLPVVAIYGANASGKTSVLAGLAYMKEAILLSHRIWEPEGGTRREPFAWSGMPEQPSIFEVTAVIGGIRYQYGFRVDDQRFLEEWLYAWPAGRKQTWLERDADALKFGAALTDEKTRLIEEVTRPNALFLSVAAQHGHERLAPIFSWFLGLENVNTSKYSGSDYQRASATRWLHGRLKADAQELQESGESSSSAAKFFINILRTADLGIMDVRTEEIPKAYRPPSFGIGDPRPAIQVFVRHQSQDDDAWLPLEKESLGTATLFEYGRRIVEALEHGWVLVIDELERSLHPVLALRIVALFNDAKSNPRNAQLIFSTHDTNLLGRVSGDAPLRRDQVWLTEKNDRGATELYPLTDFKARKHENLERGYLQGRYGAVPVLGNLDVSGD